MAERRDEEPAEFKVVDRRLFTPDGQRRTDAEPEPEKPEPPRARPQQEQPPPSQPKSEPPPAPPRPEGRDAVQFEHLILSLASTAMLHLGMAARPGEPPSPPDLPAAQETIDLLALLQQKTRGNLTREEEELLSGSLQELRLVFVELARRAGRVR